MRRRRMLASALLVIAAVAGLIWWQYDRAVRLWPDVWIANPSYVPLPLHTARRVSFYFRAAHIRHLQANDIDRIEIQSGGAGGYQDAIVLSQDRDPAAFSRLVEALHKVKPSYGGGYALLGTDTMTIFPKTGDPVRVLAAPWENLICSPLEAPELLDALYDVTSAYWDRKSAWVGTFSLREYRNEESHGSSDQQERR